MAKKLVFAFREVDVPDEPPLTPRERILMPLAILLFGALMAAVIYTLMLAGKGIGWLAGALLA